MSKINEKFKFLSKDYIIKWTQNPCDDISIIENVICNMNHFSAAQIKKFFGDCKWIEHYKINYAKIPMVMHLMALFEHFFNDKIDKALELYNEAAQFGCPLSYSGIGYIYMHKKEFCKALIYYKEAAAYDYPVAIYNVGYCYQIMPSNDNKTALTWYIKAADTGYETVIDLIISAFGDHLPLRTKWDYYYKKALCGDMNYINYMITHYNSVEHKNDIKHKELLQLKQDLSNK